LPQKLNSDGLEDLHCGQMLSNFVPHLPQNSISEGFSNRHFGHFILMPSDGLLSKKS